MPSKNRTPKPKNESLVTYQCATKRCTIIAYGIGLCSKVIGKLFYFDISARFAFSKDRYGCKYQTTFKAKKVYCRGGVRVEIKTAN